MNCVFGNRKAEGASLAGLKAQLRDIDRGRRGLVIKEAPNECADRKTSLAVNSIVDQMWCFGSSCRRLTSAAFLDPEFTPT
jgi:hypothetical protein